MNPIVVMGVTGSGKSTLGRALAEALPNGLFFDADDYHPVHNKEKMASGKPLTDEDRLPWLLRLRDLFQQHPDHRVVLACSALKQSYRDLLQQGSDSVPILYVFLDGSMELIMHRLTARTNHFMNPALLQSQFDTLERPTGEHVMPVTIGSDTPEQMARQVISHFTL